MEGLVWWDTAIFHGFGGFMVEVSTEFMVIGIEGDDDPHVVHEGSVVGDGVDDFVFVGPPVGEGGAGSAMFGHSFGDFVTFEDML